MEGWRTIDNMPIVGPDLRLPWSLSNYFTKIFVINRDSRTDRWEKCVDQIHRFQLHKVERLSAFEIFSDCGKLIPVAGCAASHRFILDLATYNKWDRVLILEDDFLILHDDFHRRWESMILGVPNDWDVLYLGGHYGDAPLARVSGQVIRCNRMSAASSYGITWKHAKRVARLLYDENAIDSVLSNLAFRNKHFILQPRLMAQYESYSDIGQRVLIPYGSMTDTTHERMV